jgi:hypothetical protein
MRFFRSGDGNDVCPKMNQSLIHEAPSHAFFVLNPMAMALAMITSARLAFRPSSTSTLIKIRPGRLFFLVRF